MIRVLVVEDDKYFNKLLSDFLRLEGFEVISVLDGEEAWNELQLAHAEGRAFDCLVVDMLLPKKMGAELLTEINESKILEPLRRFAMSGIYKNEAEISQIKILYQLEAFLTKPFDLDLLSSYLRKKKPEEKSTESFSTSGDLAHRPVEHLFFDAYRTAFTGRLNLKRDTTERRIYFLNGHPVSANSSAISESFGQALVNMKYIDVPTREDASRKMVLDQKHFGETLVEMGAIKKNDLFVALREHTRELILRSFLSRQGDFHFEKLEELPSYLPRIEFNPFILMLEAQQKLISIEALASVSNLKMEMFPRKERRWQQLISLFNSSEACLQVLTTLDTSVSLKETLKQLESSTRRELLRVFYLLESIEILSWKETPESDPLTDEKLGFDFHKTGDIPLPASAQTKEVDEKIFARYMDTLNFNFLELLRVNEDVSEAELREAYRQVRFEFHPDRFGDQISGQSQRILDDILARLDKAYQTLSNEESREEYLNTLRKISVDSAQQSKKYLQALDLFREAKKLMESESFEAAQGKFNEAFSIWPSGIEYKLYSVFSGIRHQRKTRKDYDLNPDLQKFRELAYSYSHSETGFLLLGHLYRIQKQFEAAREAYNKARNINPSSNEIENAMVRLANEEKAAKGVSLKVNVPAKILRKTLLYLLLLGALVGVYSQRDRFSTSNEDVRALDVSLIKAILPVKSIRKKDELAKIVVEKDSIEALPEAVLKSKCLQIFEKIGLYGIMRIYLFEEGVGLKAFCTEHRFEKY